MVDSHRTGHIRIYILYAVKAYADDSLIHKYIHTSLLLRDVKLPILAMINCLAENGGSLDAT